MGKKDGDMTRTDCLNLVSEDIELLFLEEDYFDEAILGVITVFGGMCRVVYSREDILRILVSRGMEYPEAQEYFEFNIEGSYVGEQTPVFLYA